MAHQRLLRQMLNKMLQKTKPSGISLLAVTIVMMAATLAHGDSLDWPAAEKGILVGAFVAFSGCTPAAGVIDKARTVALLKAKVNISRTRELMVSGTEHAVTDSSGKNQYSFTVAEKTSATLRPVRLIKEELVVLEGVSNLCVLVAEN